MHGIYTCVCVCVCVYSFSVCLFFSLNFFLFILLPVPPFCDYYSLMEVLVTQSCLTLCNPMDCSTPGSSVHGILQAGILEWVAVPSPGNLPNQESNLGLPHYRQILYHLSHIVCWSRASFWWMSCGHQWDHKKKKALWVGWFPWDPRGSYCVMYLLASDAAHTHPPFCPFIPKSPCLARSYYPIFSHRWSHNFPTRR